MRSSGGGIFLMIALLVGAVVGLRHGEGTLGILIGLGIGLLAALLVSIWDARRRARRDGGMNGAA